MPGPADLAYVETRSPGDLNEADKLVEAEVEVLMADEDYKVVLPTLSERAATESRWGRVSPLVFEATGPLADAYRLREADNLQLLEELGPTHWSTVNYSLEPTVKAAEAAVVEIRNQVNELNALRQKKHQEAFETVTYLEDRWRSKVRTIIDEYVLSLDG